MTTKSFIGTWALRFQGATWIFDPQLPRCSCSRDNRFSKKRKCGDWRAYCATTVTKSLCLTLVLDFSYYNIMLRHAVSELQWIRQ